MVSDQPLNRVRCVLCKTLKKGCRGGLPCDRCLHLGRQCIAGDPADRRAPNRNRKTTARLQTGGKRLPAPPQQLLPALATNGAQENAGNDVQDESESLPETTAPEMVLSTVPRIESLRTKANGPDAHPEASWSYVGNGQYCLTEGYSRVMAKKQVRAEKQREADARQEMVDNESIDEEELQENYNGGALREDAQQKSVTKPSKTAGFLSAPYRRDSGVQGSRRQLGTGIFAGDGYAGLPTYPTSTFPATGQAPGNAPDSRNAQDGYVQSPQDIVAAQQQQEDYYQHVAKTMAPGVSANRQGEMTMRDGGMPPPTVEAGLSTSQYGNMPFGNARSTHISDAEYATISMPASSQRLKTPPLPNSAAPVEARGATPQQGQAQPPAISTSAPSTEPSDPSVEQHSTNDIFRGLPLFDELEGMCLICKEPPTKHAFWCDHYPTKAFDMSQFGQ